MTSSQPAPLSAEVPRRIAGRYRIEAELGRGGMGAVYRAHDEGCDRVVALKLLTHADARLAALFEREYETLAKLDHPRVIAVYDFGLTEDGQHYYTMELLGGKDLWALAPLTWRDTCRYGRDVCTSLALLHNQRLIHRDVNPPNVRLDDQGHAKLLDFGALTPFGRATELVGTPLCIAPEALRNESLDGRTDLYSLGVVMYWALTRERPYAIRELADAEEAWRVPPRPLSQFVPDIPAALNELVMSLISIDPLGRPASAADVIDRLSAIGNLDDGLLQNIAESRLASGVLVGRELEQSQLQQLCDATLHGKGGVITVLGEAGTGRSRLLSELSIAARIGGLRTVSVSGQACAEQGRLLHTLVQAVFAVAPDDARACLRPYLSSLGPLLAENDGRDAHAPPPPPDPLERVLQQQDDVAAWIAEVAQRRPLLLAIDDAHMLRAESALVLTLLARVARRTPLLLAVSRLSDRPAPPAVEQLVFMGESLVLNALSQTAVEELLYSIFGDVPHRMRLAQWLITNERGNPGQMMRRLRRLIARSVIQDVGGTWTLPAVLTDTALEGDAETTFLERVLTLPALAQRLARALALHGSILSEETCVKLGAGAAHGRVVQALRQLGTEQFVLETPEGYRVVSAAAGSALLAGVSAEARAALHLELAEAIRSVEPGAMQSIARNAVAGVSTPQLVRAISMGLHLMRGGRAAQGSTLLRRAAVELTVRGELLAQAAPDLEAAVETHRALGMHRYRYVALLPPLTLAGTYVDYRLSFRYGAELMDVLEQISGLRAARRLSRFLGGHAALWLCMGWAFLAFMLIPRRRQAAGSFRDVLLGLIGIGTALLSVCTILQDSERAVALAAQLSMLRYFPPQHPVNKVHQFQVSLVHLVRGEFGTARALAVSALDYMRSAAARRLPQDARNQLEAGILTMLGVLDAMRTDDAVDQDLAAIERLNTFTSRQTRETTLVAYHGHRGERTLFLRHLEELDRLAAETNAVWRHDVQVPRLLWSSLALCEDVMGLKRAAQQIEALATEVPSVARLRDVTQACYLSERGLPHEALARYGALFESVRGKRQSMRDVQYLGAYARILRKAGNPALARQVCEEALLDIAEDDAQFSLMTFGAELELPLAHAELGDHERARALLDALIGKQAGHDNPMIQGLVHGARANLALTLGDEQGYAGHLEQMERWLRTTEHPTLFAQYQRLAAKKRVHAATCAGDLSDGALSSDMETVQLGSDLFERALRRTLEEAGAVGGVLFMLREGALQHVASARVDMPPRDVQLEIARAIATYAGATFQTELLEPGKTNPATQYGPTDEATVAPMPLTWLGRRAFAFLLAPPSTGIPSAIGALVLVEGDAALGPVSSPFLTRIAERLRDQ